MSNDNKNQVEQTVDAACDLIETVASKPVETAIVVVETPFKVAGAILSGLLGL